MKKKMAISRVGFFIITCMALLTCVYALFSSKDYPTSTFTKSFSRLFGNDHVVFLDNEGKSVQISIDRSTGSGFISQKVYLHAYFSASIKLQAGYTAGVVTTFYTSNVNMYETSTHDELDFEFLGNIEGQQWIVQTNVYGNGSINRGREERYNLWFDPTQDFHDYGILWTHKWIVFYVDNIPIREMQRVDAMGGDFPSKPMSLYATIWDGSSWATAPIDYTYAPFVANYSNFVLQGCSVDPSHKPPKCDGEFELGLSYKGLTIEERTRMKKFRSKHMTYSYCHDRSRYPTPLPECVMNPEEVRS